MKHLLPSIAFSLLLAAVSAAAAVPDWLKSAAALPLPAELDHAPAYVLVDDATVEIDETGSLVETQRYAVRIIHNAGRKFAQGEVYYNGAAAKVESLGAWVVRGGKQFESRGASEWIDFSAGSAGAIVDEIRKRTVDLSGRALSDDVFGFESRVRMPMLVSQLWLEFGGMLPKRVQSYVVTVPSGFELDVTGGDNTGIQMTHADARHWSWTLTGQPYRPEEVSEAGAGRIDANILIQVTPPATATRYKPGRFETWKDVVALSDSLNRTQCDSSPVLADKARALADGSVDPLEVIRRIGAHVQGLRYVALNRGLRYGHGWRARKATEVFSAGFGDCKDKANLMVALLREAGVPANMVIARYDRRTAVRPDFPSPIQFDHAIVAIPVADSVNLPTVVPVPGLGRCLIFDPTDSQSRVGDLSLSLQGSLALVLAPGVERLVQLPSLPPEQGFRTERRAELALQPDGTIVIAGTVTGTQQVGSWMRGAFKEMKEPAEIDKLIVRQLGTRLRGATIVSRKTSDDPVGDRTELAFTCGLTGYMQLTASANPVVRLDVLSRDFVPNLTESRRRLPVDLQPQDVVDDIKLNLPDGYDVSEVPTQVSLQSEYGSLLVTYAVEDRAVRMRRDFVLRRQVVPVSDFPKLKKFLADAARADRSSILLRRVAAPAAASGGR